MERKQDNLLPIGEALAGLDGPVKALAKSDQRAYLNRMLRLALPFFRRRNILRENASSNARYPGLVGYAISCSSCAVDMDQ